MTAPLPELHDLWVAPDLRRAGLGGRAVEAAEPRDLEVRLGSAVYEVVHLRRPEPIPNQARMVRDLPFEAELTAAVPHAEVRLPTVVRRRDPRRGACLVEWAGVAVWVPDSRVLGDHETAQLLVPAQHPAMSPGFLLVQGSTSAERADPWLRAYVHVREPAGAPVVWGAVLGALEDAAVTYRAKIASVRWLYPRSDALTVYLPRGSWDAARLVAEAVAGRPEVDPAVSAFCRRLAPGVAVGWQPADPRPGRGGLSLGEHRASVVAQTAIEAARRGRPWSADLPAAWRTAAVDPAALWRNESSPHLALAEEATTAYPAEHQTSPVLATAGASDDVAGAPAAG